MMYDKLTRHAQDVNLNIKKIRVKRQQNFALIAIACRFRSLDLFVFTQNVCLKMTQFFYHRCLFFRVPDFDAKSLLMWKKSYKLCVHMNKQFNTVKRN